MNACSDAIEWVGDKTFKEVWETCPRGDWMLWLAVMLKVNHRTLTLAKGLCAETVVHLMDDERSVNAVKAAIAYGNGEITNEELAAADAHAYAAAAAHANAYAAAAAAAAAADANAYAATDANAYAYAAAAAAHANAYAAAADAHANAYAAAADAAHIKNKKATADICRKILTEEISKHF